MMWSSRQLRPQWARDLMFVSGVLTVLYNGANFLRQERGEEPLP